MQDTMVDAVMVYSLHEPEISIENLTVPELTSQGIVYGVETPVKDVLSDKDVLIEARAVKNEKGCFVCIVRYPEFEGCWIWRKAGNRRFLWKESVQMLCWIRGINKFKIEA